MKEKINALKTSLAELKKYDNIDNSEREKESARLIALYGICCHLCDEYHAISSLRLTKEDFYTIKNLFYVRTNLTFKDFASSIASYIYDLEMFSKYSGTYFNVLNYLNTYNPSKEPINLIDLSLNLQSININPDHDFLLEYEHKLIFPVKVLSELVDLNKLYSAFIETKDLFYVKERLREWKQEECEKKAQESKKQAEKARQARLKANQELTTSATKLAKKQLLITSIPLSFALLIIVNIIILLFAYYFVYYNSKILFYIEIAIFPIVVFILYLIRCRSNDLEKAISKNRDKLRNKFPEKFNVEVYKEHDSDYYKKQLIERTLLSVQSSFTDFSIKHIFQNDNIPIIIKKIADIIADLYENELKDYNLKEGLDFCRDMLINGTAKSMKEASQVYYLNLHDEAEARRREEEWARSEERDAKRRAEEWAEFRKKQKEADEERERQHTIVKIIGTGLAAIAGAENRKNEKLDKLNDELKDLNRKLDD